MFQQVARLQAADVAMPQALRSKPCVCAMPVEMLNSAIHANIGTGPGTWSTLGTSSLNSYCFNFIT